ncbi:MAG: hypothetical protein KF768_01595 [Phycisphaeraceae bacterium]|nr:hypothetical protein [Phycisphaeraceae bacterium]
MTAPPFRAPALPPSANAERLRYDRRAHRRRRFGWVLIVVGSLLAVVVVAACLWMVNRQWHGLYRSAQGRSVQWQLANGAVMVHAFQLTPLAEGYPPRLDSTVVHRSQARMGGIFRSWHWVPRIGSAPKAAGGGPAVRLPMWVPGVVGVVMIGTGLRLIREVDSSRCARCRYLLTGLSPQTTRCPECGHLLPLRDHAVHTESNPERTTPGPGGGIERGGS